MNAANMVVSGARLHAAKDFKGRNGEVYSPSDVVTVLHLPSLRDFTTALQTKLGRRVQSVRKKVDGVEFRIDDDQELVVHLSSGGKAVTFEV